ncbi:hypothetical protein U9M48_019550 [Paspalum notatum var. saurae]|uniref:F-box domain-containing protein n=1 Tax=Paspalum notatum var. saurae TaxID=547442 RepID=A0AAQ3TDD6_PASNO
MDSRRQEKEDEREGCPCGGATEAVDHSDHLHDTVLLDVFTRIGDVKALGHCALLSRRLHAQPMEQRLVYSEYHTSRKVEQLEPFPVQHQQDGNSAMEAVTDKIKKN